MSCSKPGCDVVVTSGNVTLPPLTRGHARAFVTSVTAVSGYIRGGYLWIAGATYLVSYICKVRTPNDTKDTDVTKATTRRLIREGVVTSVNRRRRHTDVTSNYRRVIGEVLGNV